MVDAHTRINTFPVLRRNKKRGKIKEIIQLRETKIISLKYNTIEIQCSNPITSREFEFL